MSTRDALAWLKQVASQLGFDRTDELGTHSCKRTLLSIAAKAGMSLSQRRLLGGHTRADDKAVIIYSRDHLAAPLRELQKVIELVRRGVFAPDVTRSGRWRDERDSIEQRNFASSEENEASRGRAETESSSSRSVARGEESPAQTEEKEGDLSEASSSERPSTSSVSKAPGEGGEEVGGSEQTFSAAEVPPEGMWANRRWKTLHLLHPSTVGLTGCGLVLSPATGEVVRSWPKATHRICARYGCFHNRVST